jgi:DNA repair exonuclease SbcCD ATPase subunit
MPALAIVAKDSQSLSPARASLAQLIHRRAQLQSEAEPLHQRLQRCDSAIAEAARATQRVVALSAEHQSRFAAAIANGDPPPHKPHDLLRAEAAEAARAAAEQARASVAPETDVVNQQLGALGREIADQIAAVSVEAALNYARSAYSDAFRKMNVIAAHIDGVHAELRDIGMRAQQTGGGLGAMRALERLETELRQLRTRLASEQSDDRAPARRLLEALDTDPSAELEP